MNRPMLPSLSVRQAWCDRYVTLDGKPATLSGARNRFATVTDQNGMALQFSWTAVARVMGGEGNFKC